MRKIGVFDSGVGGLSVATAIEKALPNHQVIFRDDKKNVPYGIKNKQELLKLVSPILKSMAEDGCEVIVIACNTVTTTLIHELRHNISIPLIGMEAMIKPASIKTKSNYIAVFATPTTLASSRYYDLKKQYTKDIKVIEPDCSDWSYMIESNQINKDKIHTITESVCNQGADVIVLGCTHYHWIEDLIKQSAGSRAEVLQPEAPVIKQLKNILTNLEPEQQL